MRPAQKKGVSYSAVLHSIILFLIIVGLPTFFIYRQTEEPTAITVEILPISAVSNVRPAEEKPAPKEAPKSEKHVTPTVKETPPPPPPPPKEVAEIKKPEEKKPEEKKPEKKATDEDLMAVLKSLKQAAADAPKEQKETPKEEDTSKSKSISQTYNSEMPLTVSEKDALRSQLAKCWNVPAGAKNAHELVVIVHVQALEDGNVTKVELADESKSRYAADSFFRAAADSAMRAVRQCSPLKNLPPDKYDTWKDMELTFDPKEMLF